MDARRYLIDVYIGLPKSVNDFLILQKFGLYRQVQYNETFFNMDKCQYSFSPYLFKDKGYPLFSWITKLTKKANNI